MKPLRSAAYLLIVWSSCFLHLAAQSTSNCSVATVDGPSINPHITSCGGGIPIVTSTTYTEGFTYTIVCTALATAATNPDQITSISNGNSPVNVTGVCNGTINCSPYANSFEETDADSVPGNNTAAVDIQSYYSAGLTYHGIGFAICVAGPVYEWSGQCAATACADCYSALQYPELPRKSEEPDLNVTQGA
jgi:hypothetical protein